MYDVLKWGLDEYIEAFIDKMAICCHCFSLFSSMPLPFLFTSFVAHNTLLPSIWCLNAYEVRRLLQRDQHCPHARDKVDISRLSHIALSKQNTIIDDSNYVLMHEWMQIYCKCSLHQTTNNSKWIVYKTSPSSGAHYQIEMKYSRNWNKRCPLTVELKQYNQKAKNLFIFYTNECEFKSKTIKQKRWRRNKWRMSRLLIFNSTIKKHKANNRNNANRLKCFTFFIRKKN